MTKRQKRVQKILEIRERHLDQSANQLTRAREAAEQAARALEEQQRRTLEALREREQLAQRKVSAHEWIDSEAWRMRLGNQERALSEKAAHAQIVVQKAHQEMLLARTEVKKIETWKENLIQSERQVTEQKDRRAEDEFAALRARMTKEGR